LETNPYPWGARDRCDFVTRWEVGVTVTAAVYQASNTLPNLPGRSMNSNASTA
jgi:hypothetical protein